MECTRDPVSEIASQEDTPNEQIIDQDEQGRKKAKKKSISKEIRKNSKRKVRKEAIQPLR
jgi:hypothetical protein